MPGDPRVDADVAKAPYAQPILTRARRRTTAAGWLADRKSRNWKHMSGAKK